MSLQKLRKYCLKILKVVSEGVEKEYKFQEQQEAEEVEAEYWEKKQSEEQQQKLQKKYQRLKYDQEEQQQRQPKLTEINGQRNKYRMMMMMILLWPNSHRNNHWNAKKLSAT